MAYSLVLIDSHQKISINGSLGSIPFVVFLLFYLILVIFPPAIQGITAPFQCPDGCDCDPINDKVDCIGRGISSLNLSFSANIRVLLCDDNDFREISQENINLTHLRKLRKLSFSNNAITIVRQGSFQGLGKIFYLDLSRNNLRSIPSDVRLLRSLNTLDLRENFIQRIRRDDFHPESKLEVLMLPYNKLETLEIDTFTNLASLLYLELQNNSISNISNRVFNSNAYLRDIDLSENQIGLFDGIVNVSDWFQMPMLSLNKLVLARNMIQGFMNGAFDSLTELLTLEIQFNAISELNHNVFQKLHTLEVLMANDNQLQSLPLQLFKGSPNILTIDFSYNILSDIPPGIFSTNGDLYSIDFSGNELDDVDWVVYTSSGLRELYLGGNAVGSLPDITFKFCVNLEILQLQDNVLTEFPMLMNMTYLQTLDLTNNYISTIPSDTRFYNYPNLLYISLAGNQLSTLDEAVFSTLPSVEAFRVDENPFWCDCKLLWLDDIFIMYLNDEEYPPWLPETFESMVCDQPKSFRGEFVSNLAQNRNNLGCSSFGDRRAVVGLVLGWMILLLTVVGVYWRWKIKKARRHMRAWKTKRRKKKFRDRFGDHAKHAKSNGDHTEEHGSNGRVKMYNPNQHEYVSQFDRDSYHSVANAGDRKFSPACVCLLQHDDSMQSCDLLSETTV